MQKPRAPATIYTKGLFYHDTAQESVQNTACVLSILHNLIEQGQKTGGRPFYTACGWACLYTLAAMPAAATTSSTAAAATTAVAADETVEAPAARFALQMVHEWDSCCFQAGNLHTNISHYNKFVQSQLTDGQSWFQTSANLGNFHEINYRDKVTLGVMIERLRRSTGLQRSHFNDLPFNVILDDWG